MNPAIIIRPPSRRFQSWYGMAIKPPRGQLILRHEHIAVDRKGVIAKLAKYLPEPKHP